MLILVSSLKNTIVLIGSNILILLYIPNIINTIYDIQIYL